MTSLTSRNRNRVFLGAALVLLVAGACTLDFGKFEEVAVGAGASSSSGGVGVTGGSTVTAGAGGVGGVPVGGAPMGGLPVGGSGGSGGIAVPPLDNGQPCDPEIPCASGFCADALCCDTACQGLCHACSNALSGGGDGTCTAIADMADPQNECPGAENCNGLGLCTGVQCGLEPAPVPIPPGDCPAICNGGCDQATCLIQCGNGSNCKGKTVACPAGLACTIECSTSGGCDGSSIVCPDSYACLVACTAADACADAKVSCSVAGTCNLSCTNHDKACDKTALTCGDNTCAVNCTVGQKNAPSQKNCVQSCDCTSMGC